MKLKIGIPKGSLQKSTVEIFKKAGYNIRISKRSYFPTCDDKDLQFVLLRAQEMSRYVEENVLDCGITGNDWILNNESDIVKVSDLVYAKQSLNPVRWVVAVPQDSEIKEIGQLEGRRVATELVNVTENYFKDKRIDANIEFSWGATEAKVASGLVDGIVELTETGSSLKANNLKVIDTVCKSTTQFIANKSSWDNVEKRKKIKNLSILLRGAVLAEEKVGLKMNVPKEKLEKVISLLPALREPTVSKLVHSEWVAVEIVVEEEEVKRLIPELKREGVEGIIEYPLSKIIP